MSEFFKFAYEILSQIVYYLAAFAVAALQLFVTGWVDYFKIFLTYFPTLNIPGKILSVLLIAIPVLIILLIVRRAILHHQLKTDKSDNEALYREIGRLNKQVLDLMEEKNNILAIKAVVEEAPVVNNHRFPKLSLVDEKYLDFVRPPYNEEITLEQFAEGYRFYACSQLGLYYTPEIVRRFVAGMAASKMLILEGISGTGKTSLPYSFSRYLDNPATIVSVQPSYRDRSEILGYFNEFSKRFNETEFLRALYEANYRPDPSFIVLDEMNIARVEYYFAEVLSVLEMPSKEEWTLDLVPTAWEGDPKLLTDGKIRVSDSTWFVGTANNDDSTFTITDKVYDRAMPIELNDRADEFTCPANGPCYIRAERLMELFEKAKEEHPISDELMEKMEKLDQYLVTRFRLAFGNRIMKQLYDFIPVYVACGGTELGGMDYIVARKVLKKFESMNVAFVRDEMTGLIEYIEKTFGPAGMPDSIAYLERIKNMY